ncbi:nuclear transport factor 2 family protein [Kibdelosporangium lantanae]|uniref:Nuclear transport factor 2 family protein n=1 Tax=Kibdelosporangium lantanae TaxID=1497396 RepID=A0ABW3M444_9PSEU
MDTVLDLVQQWAAAELAGDADALTELLDENFAGIGPVGFVLNREQWAGRHRDGNLTNHAIEIIDPQLTHYGDTVIVRAVMDQKTTARGRDTSGSFRIGVVAVRRGEQWVIAHLQLSGPMITPGEVPPFAR